MIPPVLKGLYTQLENALKNAGVIAGKSGRHMKFPYTFSAKVAQFPYFFYMKNNWIWMYYPVGICTAFYAFAKIHSISNSEESKRSWAETQRKAAEKEHHDH